MALSEWWSVILFYAIVALIIIWKRKKIERQLGVAFFYRTKKGLSTVRRIAEKYSKFWKGFGYAAIPIGFAGMVWFFYFMAKFASKVILHPETIKPIGGIVAPGVKVAVYGPILTVPILYFVIAIAITISIHELCHALVGHAHGLKLKSAGAGLFAVLPFAFVEIDEEQLEKQKARVQLSTFAAGPFANLVAAVVFILLSAAILPAALSTANGAIVTELFEGAPAQASGLQVGDIITSANGLPVKNGLEFESFVRSVQPGDEVLLLTQRGEVAIKTIENPNAPGLAFIGIKGLRTVFGLLGELHNILRWIFIFNLGVGLVNLLPLGPIDGGRMAKTVFLRFIKKQKIAVGSWKVLSSLTLFMLLLSIFGPSLIKVLG